jgi:hypothetical protein
MRPGVSSGRPQGLGRSKQRLGCCKDSRARLSGRRGRPRRGLRPGASRTWIRTPRPASGTQRQEQLSCAHAHRPPNSKNPQSRASSPRTHRCGRGACMRGAGERLRLVQLILDELHSGVDQPGHHSRRGVDRTEHPHRAPPQSHGRLPRDRAAGKGQDVRMHRHDSRRQAASRPRENTLHRDHPEQPRLRHIRGEVGGSAPAACAAGARVDSAMARSGAGYARFSCSTAGAPPVTCPVTCSFPCPPCCSAARSAT